MRLILVLLLASVSVAAQESLPLVKVEQQPFAAQVNRVLEAR